jgi:Cu+-exporting ATPase
MAKDPICGMDGSESAALKLTKDGKLYYFCSEHCLKRFAKQSNINDKVVAACVV